MRKTFPNRQLAHVWAQQSQPEGRGSNFYFEGPTACLSSVAIGSRRTSSSASRASWG